MTGLSFHFTYPWLLLLLIPAAAISVIPYFFLNKKYRRTRNRIISMVLHGIVMLLAVLALSGLTFEYSVHNDENEIILLVDVSDTENVAAARRDAFVEEIVNESQYDGYKIGIVTFGFDQRYAVPLTADIENVMEDYYAAELPDVTATDIADALRYATTLFGHRESGKIVLITDGKQTDENALSVARSIAAQGIKVDTVNISEEFESDGVCVIDVVYPKYHVNLNEECMIEVKLSSKVADRVATVELYDGSDGSVERQEADLIIGTQVITFPKTFSKDGVHEIVVRASLNGDTLEENNSYSSYFNLEIFSHILVLEQAEGQSEQLEAILSSGEISYDMDIVNLKNDLDKVPASIEELRKYDQVILNNVANSDLPMGLDELLYNYVYTYGGGLFTTGGSDGEGNAHAYNRSDLVNTLYQQMLPVQAINYTPPVGVEIVIDVSGSMMGEKLEAAKRGAIECLDVLNDRDYIGVVTLSTTYGTILQPTRRTQDAKIKEAIQSVTIGGNTVYSNAIARAGEALKTLKHVDNRHIIMVTDGAPTESESIYLPIAQRFYQEDGITLSVIAISMPPSQQTMMERLTEEAGGKLYQVDDLSQLGILMQNDLMAEEIRESEQVEFHPIIVNPLSNLANGLEHEDFDEEEENGNLVTKWRLKTTLDGFYGVRARASAETFLVGKYEVPIYSQWKFGKGMVGSFMCDVYGEWSSDFLSDANGIRFLRNVVGNLMPTEDIRTKEIVLNLREENYFNQLGISAQLGDGEKIEGEIIFTDENGEERRISISTPPETVFEDMYVTTYLSEANRFSRCNFVLKTSGLYRIEVRKLGADGNVLAAEEIYKSFAYSKEYMPWENTDETMNNGVLLAEISERGNGKVVEEDDPWSIFAEFVTELYRSYDPRFAFMIISIILFLLDIAVRKFKFKWIHEIISERKERKAAQQ